MEGVAGIAVGGGSASGWGISHGTGVRGMGGTDGRSSLLPGIV